MAILIFFVTIFILVIIHELGHFFAAKKFNIKVLEFGFGLPPKLFGKKWGETLVSLNWLPFGGFVKLKGEDDDDPKALTDPRSFASQNVWKRITVVAAGVLMNLVLAWVIYYGLIAFQGFKVQIPLLVEHDFVGVSQTKETVVIISNVASDSPASQVGIVQGDRIIAINDQFIENSEEFSNKIKENAGKKVTLTLSDVSKNKFRNVEVTPRENPPQGQGALGVALGSFKVANLEFAAFWQKLLAAPIHTFNLTSYSFEILGNTIRTAFVKKDIAPVGQTVAGPVGITSLIGDILRIDNPIIPYLEFLALLSLNLAIFNALPLPALDGGRLLFLFTEAIIGKRVPPSTEKIIHAVGFALLISLAILITVSDIKKLF
ncbi:MAG: Site-2 protease, Metallo peptidase, MEROPS family M50B [Candidatus Daviesbacteria bacterium GW2011_GWA2_38_24]|uniref:Site-2 protease, Metallo peptidase, MEROPS family M50B n=1 Tax=Candidatus Daviesbacteria bacterium GW2011_GWA2_38_24 TaxID=1618422 RepID=A0A0G0JGZ8_9BACT|nr:MAG: Site-2 protease, Metallo peptidase, MEROPS family M50B [Candidatus Daviesbacteria bacterium GW2011_GWA2_38_24]KKQ80983.1 MAG: Site-2 protease, Metallo peptidase, MEROPS family M50B [Candidatus Daviesbacteria bacterium GW2011_GWA1_38_7]